MKREISFWWLLGIKGLRDVSSIVSQLAWWTWKYKMNTLSTKLQQRQFFNLFFPFELTKSTSMIMIVWIIESFFERLQIRIETALFSDKEIR